MVKLIRLSTSDNNGVFRCNFDTDVILKENAQIALRNIVFEPDRLEKSLHILLMMMGLLILLRQM